MNKCEHRYPKRTYLKGERTNWNWNLVYEPCPKCTPAEHAYFWLQFEELVIEG